MKTRWNYSNYGNNLALTLVDAESCSHSGDCSFSVDDVMNKRYIKKQLANIDKNDLAKELKEYGAWDEIELKDHAANLKRWLWLSANDIAEAAFDNRK